MPIKQVRQAIEEMPDGSYRILEPAVSGNTVVITSGSAPSEVNDPAVRVIQAEDSVVEQLDIQRAVRRADTAEAGKLKRDRDAAKAEREKAERDEKEKEEKEEKPSHGKK